MKIRPIRTEDDYRKALAAVDALWVKAQPGTDAGDHLDMLITLIQAYEREHHPILPPDPIEAIKFRMEQGGISKKRLEDILGKQSRVTEVLSRDRALSLSMIRKLHRQLDIPAEILIREVTLMKKPNRQGVRAAEKASKGVKKTQPEASHGNRAGQRASRIRTQLRRQG